jgi:hypothetical protein
MVFYAYVPPEPESSKKRLKFLEPSDTTPGVFVEIGHVHKTYLSEEVELLCSFSGTITNISFFVHPSGHVVIRKPRSSTVSIDGYRFSTNLMQEYSWSIHSIGDFNARDFVVYPANLSTCNSCGITMLKAGTDRFCSVCVNEIEEAEDEDEMILHSCSLCGDTADGMVMLRNNGPTWVCDECRSERLSYCQHCDTFGTTACNRCQPKGYTRCTGCGTFVPDELKKKMFSRMFENKCKSCELKQLNRSDGVYSYNFKPHRYNFLSSKNEKSPTFLGFELEMELKQNISRSVAYQFNNDYHYTKHDGSLSNGFEIVTHPMSISWIKENRHVFENIYTFVPKVFYPDPSTCGLHVHISRNAFENSLKLYKALRFIVDEYDFFYEISGRVDRDRFERYCAKNERIKSSARMQIVERTDETHHEIFSLCNKHTVELRSFGPANSVDRFMVIVEFVDVFIKYINSHSIPKYTEFESILKKNPVIIKDSIFSSVLKGGN